MNTVTTPEKFVTGPSQRPRTTPTVRLRLLMDEAHKLEIAGRIRQLREKSHYGQQQVAERLGIGLRAYQKVEEVGTTRYERCEELARIFDVDPLWIWEGEEKPATPDPFSQNGSDRLTAIEKTLAEIADVVDRLDRRLSSKAIAAILESGSRRSSEARREGRGGGHS